MLTAFCRCSCTRLMAPGGDFFSAALEKRDSSSSDQASPLAPAFVPVVVVVVEGCDVFEVFETVA